MIELLNECYKHKKIISIYNDKDDTCKHFTGYIGAIDESSILIYHVSTHGLYDGYIILPIDRIFQLNYNGKYEHKIESLYYLKKQKHEIINIKNDDILFSMLAFAQEKGYIISVELQNSILIGFIQDYNDEIITIDAITEFGECDGICKIQIDEINLISINTDEEQDVLLLQNNRIYE